MFAARPHRSRMSVTNRESLKLFNLKVISLLLSVIIRVSSNMKKLKIYLETSVLNFYFADDARDKLEATRRLFEEIGNGKYLAFISMSVIREISNAPEEKQKMLMEMVRKFGIAVLEDDPEADRIADLYVKEGIIPSKYTLDGLHIALATINDMDIIVSWNFQHIVKRKTILMTGVVNHREGYKNIDIYSPEEVIDNDEE